MTPAGEKAPPRCDTFQCREMATVFETMLGRPFKWCDECYAALQRDIREALDLVDAARTMEGVNQ